MTHALFADDIDVYVWEGTSDLLFRADRCLAEHGIRVVPADVAGAAMPRLDPTRRTVALVSVSVMAEGRFAGNDWLARHAVPVIWVASEERGYDPRFYPPDYSYTLPLSFQCVELRSLVFRLASQVEAVRKAEVPRTPERPLIAVSPVMQRVIADARMYADCDASVLVHGETGVGKERIARLLHEHSSRAAGPFVAVNCGAIPDGLFEAHFFGHGKGAFTGAVAAHKGYFEQADGGTLFLDEIGELPLDQQVKLLRVLEQRVITRLGTTAEIPVDFRVVVATHRNLRALVEQGHFRADLYYRLVVIELFVPNLEERGPQEKQALFTSMLEQNIGTVVTNIPAWLLKRVAAITFSGNVRELSNLSERVAIVKTQFGGWDEDRLDDILRQFEALSPGVAQGNNADDGTDIPLTDQEEAEKHDIIAALDQHGWRRQDTAAFLGISRKVLWEKMRKYQITAQHNA